MSKKHNKKKEDDEIFENAEKKLKELQEKVANELTEKSTQSKSTDLIKATNLFETTQPKKKSKKKEKKKNESIDSEESEEEIEVSQPQSKQNRREDAQNEKDSVNNKQAEILHHKSSKIAAEKAKLVDEKQKEKAFKDKKDKEKKKKKSEKQTEGESYSVGNIKLGQPSESNYCIIIVIVILFLFLLGTKFQEEKYHKFMSYNRNDDLGQDLYEIMEIDSAASQGDIKKQYKKLALAWHPDKNPNCGSECHGRFDKISTAYGILGNPEKRKTYDESSGVFTPIRSRTISITSHNFHRLVDDSDDLWIIQVYEDGSPRSESFAGIWDEAATKFDGTAKFGRINAGAAVDVLRKLPFKIHYFPTIIALSRYETPDIFTFPNHIGHIFTQLKKFIEKNIVNHVNFYDVNSFALANREDFAQNSAIYLNTNKEAFTLDQKYAAYKYNSWIAFYQSKFGEAKKVGLSMNITNHDAIFFKYKTDTEASIKNTVIFNNLSRKTLKQVVNIGKFLAFPEFNKETFKSFCKEEGRTVTDSQDESTSGDSAKVSLCILVFYDQNEPEKFKKFSKQVQSFQIDHAQQFSQNIKDGKDLFDLYESFQIGYLELAKHKKMTRIIGHIQKEHDIKNPLGLAINPTNNKAVFYTGEESLSDWIEDLYENEEHENVIYMNEELADQNFEDYLRSRDDSKFSIFYKELLKQITAGVTAAAFVTILLANKLLLKKSIEFSAGSALTIMLILSLATAIYQQREELF